MSAMTKEPELISEIKEKKKRGPKEISFAAMILAGAWIITLSLVKAFWGVFGAIFERLKDIPFGLTVSDIVFSGVVLAALFTPIYFSIIVDKIKEIKLGG